MTIGWAEGWGSGCQNGRTAEKQLELKRGLRRGERRRGTASGKQRGLRGAKRRASLCSKSSFVESDTRRKLQRERQEHGVHRPHREREISGGMPALSIPADGQIGSILVSGQRECPSC